MFKNENEFELALIDLLTQKGWESEILEYKTQEELIQNWANILYENNNIPDRLNGAPLTKGEMDQILEKIAALKTPFALNGLINGKTIDIKRDNPDDALHLGKEISLKIYDRAEIAAGQSRYQILRQPKFKSASPMLNDRRGDIMLLINGMPLFHIELKNSGVPISQACEQIRKYSKEGIFSGIFALVQIFVAMTPQKMLYFANPGEWEKFNDNFFFSWADFNNEPINDYRQIADKFLSIPMAHQMIGFYTIADRSDGTLKVMRSYQYYAASKISSKVAKITAQKRWGSENRGGFIWHTTGSGKTITSFKSAQLIANSGDADKVVFLIDRIELGTQSFKNYQAFADDDESVQDTNSTRTLITKLKSTNSSDTLIVTSIQKMSKIKADGTNSHDLEIINNKRVVFIVDEAHRSTFGDMIHSIKSNFNKALFFGFTGTPIHKENQKSSNTTVDVFGNELHRYSISDGIRDKNVLGFDVYMVTTYKDNDLRQAVALQKSNSNSVDEAMSDEKRKKIFLEYMQNIDMLEIEKQLPNSQYNNAEHRAKVIEDIKSNWDILSVGGKFHAILATSSISQAVKYYKEIKEKIPQLNITCLFDSNIDNDDGVIEKEEALIEILEDYNKKFNQNFTIPTHNLFKDDLSFRIAHKVHYKGVKGKEQLDLLIVVEQMLTGFDSKWINTLYVDKLMEYEKIIQAFSRTNRLFGPDKPFGTIRYYRKPYTMKENIKKAVSLYSGDRPLGLFVSKLPENIANINAKFEEISKIFKKQNIDNFSQLPQESEEKVQFAKLFNELNEFLESAKIQGFKWEKEIYNIVDENQKEVSIKVEINKPVYDALLMRYKELCDDKSSSSNPKIEQPAFDIKGYLSEKAKEKIYNDYMQTKFEKYLKALNSGDDIKNIKDELHKSFASLGEMEQKIANIILVDIESGELIVHNDKTLNEYINEYKQKQNDEKIDEICINLGLDKQKFLEVITGLNNGKKLAEINAFTELKNQADKTKAKEYFQVKENRNLKPFEVNIMLDGFLSNFFEQNRA